MAVSLTLKRMCDLSLPGISIRFRFIGSVFFFLFIQLIHAKTDGTWPVHQITAREFQALRVSHLDNLGSGALNRNGNAGADTVYPDKKQIPQKFWEALLRHGWEMSERGGGERRTSSPRGNSEATRSPFLFCVQSDSLRSGAERLPVLLERMDIFETDVSVLSNQERQSCYVLTTTADNALATATHGETEEYTIRVIPMVDVTKIGSQTFRDIEINTSWEVPYREESWEKTITVGFAPGLDIKDEHDVLDTAKEILDHVTSEIRLRGLKTDTPERSSLRATNITGEETFEREKVASPPQTFSLTSSVIWKEGGSHQAKVSDFFSRNSQFWSQTFERGLMSGHGCSTMLDQLVIEPRISNLGFRLVLNRVDKESTKNWNIDSSASNPSCVSSLVSAISTDWRTISVSMSSKLTPDSSEEQWVSQSNVENDRPFFHMGLTGRGQTVGVVDTGIDMDHCFFKDESGNGNIYNNWDMSRNKVVRYDGSLGDYSDDIGHGTHVAGTVAGIAQDSKIAFFDIKRSTGGMLNPGAETMFKSLYNNGNGAKVINGSWGTNYRAYSDFCQDYDSALHMYEEILYVASAGNTGAAGTPSMKDPALCKNVMAVGASRNGRNSDYLLEYSGRGPTIDGRIKPDVVAPGHNIESALANTPCGVTKLEGTSMAAPVVSGSGAIIRQYFEDGWYPCGSKDCFLGQALKPSGALVKAVLMNGAQALTGVKASNVFDHEEISPYDSIQNMGRINLLKSLPLVGENDIDLVVTNNKELSQGQKEDITIEVTCDTETLSFTLSWYDPASLPGCVNCLVNNLDLSIQRFDLEGNQNGAVKHPNGKSTADMVNNNERIQLSVSSGERYTISVTARSIAVTGTTQKYSLVGTGCFKVLVQPNSTRPHNSNILPQHSTGLRRPLRCKKLAKRKKQKANHCSKNEGINTLADAVCPETCGKHNIFSACNDTKVIFGFGSGGENLTCDWLKASKSRKKKYCSSGNQRKYAADAVCPLTCGWCG